MRRSPLLFGTPATPCGASTGSFKDYNYDVAQFPALTSGSGQAYSSARSYKQAVLCEPTTLPAAPIVDPPSPTVVTDPPTNRKERQFQDLCDQFRNELYGLQFTAAKAILAVLPDTLHDTWLLRLAKAMKGEVPMVEPPSTPPPRPYYKKSFRPYYADAVDLPKPLPPPVLADNTIFVSPNTQYYDYWTDRALAVYEDHSHNRDNSFAMVPRDPHRRKTCRPSSYCRLTPLRPTSPTEEDLLPKPVVTPTPLTWSVNKSKHEFQFSSHEVQHQAYQVALSDSQQNHLDYVFVRNPTASMETKGRLRWQKATMRTSIDKKLQFDLMTTPTVHWMNILLQYCTLQKLLETSTTTTSPMASSTTAYPSISTRTESAIGLGLAHFAASHRLQKRALRAAKFVQNPSHDFLSALTFELHGYHTTYPSQLSDDFPSALTFEQHGSLPSHHDLSFTFCFNSMHTILSAPQFWQHESSIQLLFLFLPGMKFTHSFSCPLFSNPASALNFQQHLDSNPVLRPSTSFTMDFFSAFHLWHHDLPCTYQQLDHSPRSLPALPCTYLRPPNSLLASSRLGIQESRTLGIFNPSLFPYDYAESCTEYSFFEQHEVLYGCLENLPHIHLGIFKHSLFPYGLRTSCSYDCDTHQDHFNISDKIHIRGQKNNSGEQNPQGPGEQEPEGHKVKLYDNRTHHFFLIRPSGPPHGLVANPNSHESLQHYTLRGFYFSTTYMDLLQWLCSHGSLRLLRDAALYFTADLTTRPPHLCPTSSSSPLALAVYEDPESDGTFFDLLSSSDESSAAFSSFVQTGIYDHSESDCSCIQTPFVQHPLADPFPILPSTSYVANKITSPPSKAIQPLTHLSGLFASHLSTLFDQYQMDCTVDDSIYDWVLRILSSNNAHGVFYHNDHWYPYVQFHSEIHLVLPSTQPNLNHIFSRTP